MNSFAKRRIVCLCFLFLALDWVLHAQEPMPQGRWEGVIETPGQALGIIVDLARPSAGAWAGKINIPMQGLSDFVLSNVRVNKARVSFAMEGVPGFPQFTGKLSKDGRQLHGIFSQGGGRFPFKLQRKGDVDPAAVAARKPPPPPIEGIPGEGLAGIWFGRLEIGQIGLRLLFRITRDQHGGFGGTVDSVDQGAMGLKISRIRFKDNSVRLRLDRPSASFEGTVSADGSEIVGHWRQSGRSTPLTIKRQKNVPDRARPRNLE
jgi:hypothetical protein